MVLLSLACTAIGLINAAGASPAGNSRSSSSHSGSSYSAPASQSCDHVETGYQCKPAISHHWGQYSPYFSVPSEIDASIPQNCEVNFVQILSRHGARDPTASKTTSYNATITKIHSSVTKYGKGYGFIKDYEYTLGADQLTTFGQQEMVNSGIKFYERYRDLARKNIPFVRTSGEDRVVESAQNWTQGYHRTRAADRGAVGTDKFPYSMVVIEEGDGINNTLNHDLCTSFEDGYDDTIGDSAQAEWLAVFMPPILARLNKNLPGADLSSKEAIYMMDLCSFNTVANADGEISKFCGLFTKAEWKSYSYYETLGKYYGYGNGNPLGPTQGVGFTNELIARLTGKRVQDHTSTNSTLDSNPETFPLHKALYADFSHDNDMTAIFSAMGLYNATAPLSNTTMENTTKTKGFSASWVVPYAARMYVEKMTCGRSSEELVRIIVNDRVIPLQNCGADKLGRCTVDKFVKSLSFAREGGHWDQCFV